jgi:hypothetical protein
VVGRNGNNLRTPSAVEAIRQIQPPQAAYRQGRASRWLLLRVEEQQVARGPLPYLFFAAIPFTLLTVGLALLSRATDLIPLAFIPHFAATLYDLERGASAKRTALGYRGAFRLDGDLLHRAVDGGADVSTELALVRGVHIHRTDEGAKLLLTMLDGEERLLAARIADVEVARYLAKEIARAATAAKLRAL